MHKDKASWTAEITAVFRATESIRPKPIRLIHDRYAALFLRPSLRWLLKHPPLALALLWLMIDRRFPGASTTAVSRIRFIDDCLEQNIHENLEQLVILGAGYDSRAYRFGGLSTKRVFEVDHPNTQKLKREKIYSIFPNPPDHVIHVPVDFEKEALVSKLVKAGYRKDLKTLFIWEAVSKYLTADAVQGLLSAVSNNACAGSAIVFDYLFQSMIDGRSDSKVAAKALQYQAARGEPFIFGLPDKNPEPIIRTMGYSKVENYTAEKIKTAYLGNTKRAKDLHPFWGIIHAKV